MVLRFAKENMNNNLMSISNEYDELVKRVLRFFFHFLLACCLAMRFDTVTMCVVVARIFK